MRKIITVGSYHDQVAVEQRYETITGISLTEPDQALTIKQIMEKHVHGLKVADELMRQPLYMEDETFDSPDLEKLGQEDIFDRQQSLEYAQQLKHSAATELKAQKQRQQQTGNDASEENAENDKQQEPEQQQPSD